MTTYIKKLRAGRVANANVSTWIGEPGTLFYNESVGTLRIADGVTPGGRSVAYTVATSTDVGGIKAGPGVVITSDGTLTIDSAGLPVSLGNLFVNNNVLSTVNANADLILESNGTGNVELVGNVHFHTTTSGGLGTPFFQATGDGQVTILVPASDPLAGAVKVVGSASGKFSPPINTGVMLHLTGNNNDASRFYNDSIGSFAAFVGRRINGNVTYPTAVQAGDELIRISSTGYNGSAIPGSGSARILYQAIENYTTSSVGTNISIWTTAIGSNVLTKTATFDNASGLTVPKATIQGNLTVQGNFIGNAITTTAIIGVANVSVLNVTNLVSTVDGMNVGTNLSVGGTATITGKLTTIDSTDISGDLTVSGNIKYNGTTNNATVTQSGATKDVAVTCNGRTGQITTNAGSIAKNASITFSMYNNYIVSSKDVVVTCIASGASINSYAISVTRINPSLHYANITLTNNGTGSLAEVLVINYALISVA